MVLLVDDDPAFLKLAELSLESCADVLFAGNAKHAKELMGSLGTEFSMALIDLDLPGEDGFSLISELHRRYPDLPLIAISGVVKKDVLEVAKLLGAVDTLQKPISSAWNSAIARAQHLRS